jgi:sulfur carrier protein
VIVQLNGEPRKLRDGTTLAAVVEELGVAGQPRGVAVAVDAEVVPRGEWERRALRDGDRVEVVTAIQGG